MAKEEQDIKNLSFEEAIRELEGIVKRLESGQSTLESAIADYSRGSVLRAHCEKKLTEAKLKIEKIIKNGETAAGTEDMVM